MKKYIFLILLLSASLSTQCADDAAANKPATKNDDIVYLTHDEKVVRDKVVNYWKHDPQMSTTNNYGLLYVGCGISMFSQKDFYNRNDYPDCENVLQFLQKLQKYAQQIETLNKELDKESQEKLHQLYQQQRKKQDQEKK